MRLRRLGVAAVGFALATLSTAPGLAQASPQNYRFDRVVSGLNEPRGLAFDGGGNLYVAQAGTPGSGTAGVTRTGAVSKFRWHDGNLKRSWSTSFTSLYMTGEGGPEVLGPAAVSATGTSCRKHQSRHDGHRGCNVLALLSESNKGVKAHTGLNVPQIGHLYRLNGRSGKPTNVSNVGDQSYKWTADHVNLFPDDFPDSNPYAVLVTRHGDHSRTFVADAGANTIGRIRSDGTFQVISYIPNETTGAKRDATPTCIAEGPDGALYVGALDLLSNLQGGPGKSNVWWVDPNSTDWEHNATLWATGFTTIDGCTFDHRGNFWASELFYPNASGPPGDLAMLKFSRHPTASAITHVGGGNIPLPGGIAEGPDGAMYVSSGAADTQPKSGAVVRVSRGGD